MPGTSAPGAVRRELAGEGKVTLVDILWGLWNGITAWPLLIVHVFGWLEQYAVYDISRDSGWYQLGYLIGAGSPFLGFIGRHKHH